MAVATFTTAERALSSILGNEERATLEIGGQSYEVVSLVGEEGVSSLFRYEIVCACPDDSPDPAGLLAGAASITLRDGFGHMRQIHGIVAEAFAQPSDDGSTELTVIVRPGVFPLTLTRDSYVLHDLDVIGVVKDVLADYHGPVRYEITRSYPKRVYCAQYREDDWTFVCRLLEEEGIYYWFDHRGGETTLVFADASSSAPDLDGGALITFAYETGMTGAKELIEEIGSESRAVPTKFTVGSFDAARPAFKVSATVGSGPLEVYHARGGNPESPAVCAARANTMLEGARAAASTVGGKSSSVRLVPGMVFEMLDHPLTRFDGHYFLTGTQVRVVQRRRGVVAADAAPYTCHFTAVRRELPYRHPQESPLAKQAGFQTGVVVGATGDEVFPDATGRVRVQLHWDRIGKRNDAAGKWMRVAQRGTASSMLLPRVGWTVVIFNEEGAIDAPNVLSRLFDGEHLPPYPLPANKTRVVFKTATTPGGSSFNEIHFEDRLGAEMMLINASRDMNVFVQNLKNDYVFQDARREIGNNHDLSVTAQSTEGVGQNQTVSIGGNESITVGAERDKTVTGDEQIKISGARTLKTGQGHENMVTLDRTLEVGSALIETTVGGFSHLAARDHTMRVDGAQVKISSLSITEDVSTTSAQKIGALKYEDAKNQRVLDVRKTLTETVHGGMLLRTQKRYIDHANTTNSWVVAAKSAATAPDVWIEAKDKIELKCGGSTIVILPDSVEIRATGFDLTQASHLEALSGVIEHN
ncbi:MAG: type VI secretion system tip protein TssI/VgrG [Minicystis sp.]